MHILDYSEKWGKDVEEAVRLALIDLKCDRDQVKIIVLEEPTRGFLGFGAKLAKVRVELVQKEKSNVKDIIDNKSASVKQETIENKVHQIKKEEPVRKLKESTSNENDSNAQTKNKETRDDRRQGKERRPSKGVKGNNTVTSRQDKALKGDNQSEFEAERNNIETKKSRYKKKEMGISKFSVIEGEEGAVPVTDGPAIDFLKEITEKMGLKLDIKAYEKDNVLFISAEGKDAGTLIGKRGQTLDAIQYLTSLVVNKDREKYLRVIVNAENYREKREKTLEQLAHRLSEKVLSTGKSVRLEPMNPYERKVIHSTLQKNGAVTTRSEGEEPYRRVIIEKKK